MDEFLSILPSDPTTLRPLRHSLGAWLDELGVTESSRDHVVLATHEAAANAMVHAQSTPVVVRARVTAGRVSVEISDRGHWRTTRENGGRGTGLTLIEALVSEVEIEKGARGTTVRLVQAQ